VFGNAQRVHQHRRFDGSHRAGQFANRVRGNTADFGGFFRRVLHHLFLQFLKSLRTGLHIFFIVQIFRDENIHQSIDQRHVGTDFQRNVYVGKINHIRPPRINHNQLGAGQHRVFHKSRSDRMRLGYIGADQNNHFGFCVIGKRICHRARTERSRQTGDGGSVSGTRAVIDIIRTDYRAEKLLHLIRIFVDTAGATDAGNGIRPVFLDDLFEFICHQIKRLIPRRLAEFAVLFSNQRRF
jgi:hypothetical protein